MPPRHAVGSYEAELGLLKSKLEQMGKVCLERLSRAVGALKRRDRKAAGRMIGADSQVGMLQADVERMIFEIVARRRQVSVNLSSMLARIQIAADLGRIAGLSEKIVRYVVEIHLLPPRESVPPILYMADVARDMLDKVVSALHDLDADAARRIWQRDELIDNAYAELIVRLREAAKRDSDRIDAFTSLLFTARCCERIGDHITNIAESICFIAEAQPCLGDKFPAGERPIVRDWLQF